MGRWEPPRDALDSLVLTAIDTGSLSEYELVEHFPFDSASKRTESTLRRRDGSVFKARRFPRLKAAAFPSCVWQLSQRKGDRLVRFLTAVPRSDDASAPLPLRPLPCEAPLSSRCLRLLTGRLAGQPLIQMHGCVQWRMAIGGCTIVGHCR